MTGQLLIKSDVYSYGVVLLELLSGRKPVHVSDLQDPESLVVWARPLLGSREGLKQLIDPYLQANCDFDSVAKVAAVASMCVHSEASQRPFMGEVVQALKLICNAKEEVGFEESYSHKESSSFGPEYEYNGDLGPDSSWWSGGSLPFTYEPNGPDSAFFNMEYSSDSMGEMQKPHFARVQSLDRYGQSNVLKSKRKKQALYRLRGSTSEHGHPLQRTNSRIYI